MPQSFCLLNTKEERTLLVRGEEITTPQAARASNSRVPRVHVYQENTRFSTYQLTLLKILSFATSHYVTSM
jgi:hypothetical protein